VLQCAAEAQVPDVSIDGGRRYVLMAEEPLEKSEIDTVL
jgi:hypothetical protein